MFQIIERQLMGVFYLIQVKEIYNPNSFHRVPFNILIKCLITGNLYVSTMNI